MEAKFFRFLKLAGAGMKAKAEAEGRLLYLKVGFRQELELTVPPAVRVFCFKPNIICCTGLDRERVHQFAASVHDCKAFDVHQGKGIMYMEEFLKKKQGDVWGPALPVVTFSCEDKTASVDTISSFCTACESSDHCPIKNSLREDELGLAAFQKNLVLVAAFHSFLVVSLMLVGQHFQL